VQTAAIAHLPWRVQIDRLLQAPPAVAGADRQTATSAHLPWRVQIPIAAEGDAAWSGRKKCCQAGC
jgi:hypothetical protein